MGQAFQSWDTTQADVNPFRPLPWDPAEFLPRLVCHQARVTAETQGGAPGRGTCVQPAPSLQTARPRCWAALEGWDPGEALEVTSEGISGSDAGGPTWDCGFIKH